MSDRTPQRPLRADARRNHDRILATTQALIAQDGPDISIDEIADASGVGVGTIYRRFDNRSALIEAAAQAAFDRVMATARAALEDPTDAWGSLSGFVHGSAADLMTIARMAVTLPRQWRRFRVTGAERGRRRRLLAVLDELIGRAQRAGVVRDDIATSDVVYLLATVLQPVAGPDQVQRQLTIVLDGLRASPDRTDLPGTAPEVD